ncbi:MAG TPA: HTH domain-containing protein [Chloroflexota bacterium]|nr:HTH domain-containing protein [Chloroflexota bacterium]HUM69328.1 HTH domain-containing protein [Chloroflexota bacterium]
MNRIDRLFAILLLLQKKSRLRAQDLAAEFEVSKRTIYRDITALSEMGVPIVSLPGEGYELVEGFFLPPLLFTDKEATALFLGARLLLQQAASTQVGDAERALTKLAVALPEKTRQQVESLTKIIGFIVPQERFNSASVRHWSHQKQKNNHKKTRLVPHQTSRVFVCYAPGRHCHGRNRSLNKFHSANLVLDKIVPSRTIPPVILCGDFENRPTLETCCGRSSNRATFNHMLDEEKKQRWIAFVQSIEPDMTPQAVRLMGEWRRISHALHQMGTASLSESGLTEAQYLVLMSLYMHEQIEGRAMLNPSEISKWRGTSRNTISSLIRGLEAEGLIERQLDDEDRRKFNICLTDDGRALVSQYAHKQFRTVGGCFNRLSDADQETLSELLAKLNQNLEETRSQLEQAQ